jgi:hypothetical protein
MIVLESANKTVSLSSNCGGFKFCSHKDTAINAPPQIFFKMAPNSMNGKSTLQSNGTPPSSITTHSQSSSQLGTLSTPSTSGTSSSQNVNKTIGIPLTPEKHAFRLVDIDGCENGYDSDGQHTPWLESNTPY